MPCWKLTDRLSNFLRCSEMVIRAITLVLLLGSVSSKPTATTDPYSPGPFEVQMNSLLPQTTGLSGVELTIWTPMTPGNYPVLYFLDGLAMSIPAAGYSEVLSHMASHGFLVVTPFLTEVIYKPSEKLPYFRNVLDWAEVNMQDVLHESGVPANVTFDFQTLFVSSNSAGSHVTVLYLKETCGNFKGLSLISPVDGADPFGLVDDFCITPGEELSFITPTLHLYAGYDAKKGAMGTACAPEKLSNERFWNALNPKSHRWSINATDFAHADVLDDDFKVYVDQTHFCAINEDLTDDDFPTYRQFVAGTVVAFFKALLEEDYAYYLKYLEDVTVMPVATTERHFTPSGERPSPYCIRETLLR